MATPKTGNPNGRPSAFRDEYIELAYDFSLLGADDKWLAKKFGVSTTTLNNWKKKHPEFLASVSKGKDLADAQVAKALFHRAKGYAHPATKAFVYKGQIVEYKYIQRYPPDTAAIALWLNTRQKKLWRRTTEDDAERDQSINFMKELEAQMRAGPMKPPDKAEPEGDE